MEKGITVTTRLDSESVKEWLIERSIREYEAGKITLWQAAKKSDVSLWEMIDEVKKRSVHVPYRIEDLKDDLEVL